MGGAHPSFPAPRWPVLAETKWIRSPERHCKPLFCSMLVCDVYPSLTFRAARAPSRLGVRSVAQLPRLTSGIPARDRPNTPPGSPTLDRAYDALSQRLSHGNRLMLVEGGAG